MLIAFLAASVLAGSSEPDAVVTTAPRGNQSVPLGAVAPVADGTPSATTAQAITPHGLTTDEQIDRWISSRDAEAKPFSDDRNGGLRLGDDRKIHGEVSAAVGSGDYSAFGATVSIPLGETGRLDLSYSQSKNSPWGYGYGYPGYGPYALQFGPSYRGAYDPFFVDSGVVVPGSRMSVRGEWGSSRARNETCDQPGRDGVLRLTRADGGCDRD